METPSIRPIARLEKFSIWIFILVIFPVFGALVEYRSAFLSRRMGDLGCFLRASWAVRTGGDLYAVTCDNDWHYNYPPLLAIAMAPLADPPRGHDTAGYIPYAWTVAICYLLNVACLYYGVHLLASALERRLGAPPPEPNSVRWWRLRWWPIFLCSLPIAHTLMRGQVNIIVLMCLCAALAGWLHGRHFRAGAWLSLAICIKVIPVYLLVYPLWKRDLRALAGCAAGLFVGLVAIPCAVLGPENTQAQYQSYVRVFFGPLFKLSKDESRKYEIIGVNSTDSVGVKNAIHNWMYPDAANRPDDLSNTGKISYILLGVAMTFVTLWRPTSRAALSREADIAHSFAGLIVLMTLFSPVCHSHYLMFCLPCAMTLVATHWNSHGFDRVPWRLFLINAVFGVTLGVSYLPGMEILKDRCAPLFSTLPLWALLVEQRWQRTSCGAATISIQRPEESCVAA